MLGSKAGMSDAADAECANCGCTDELLRCSRCRCAWFCGAKCQKAYWPFHRTYCKRNEFADAVDASEPKFARWMRSHGKLAVLKDDEVERLERAGRATAGPNRAEVLEGMYGRLEPKPIGPSYSAEERLAMEAASTAARRQAFLMDASNRAWAALEAPPQLSLMTDKYLFRQDQSHVEVFIKLPPGVLSKQARVSLSTRHLCVAFSNEDTYMSGTLFNDIQTSSSTWFIDDGILHLLLLKRNRRGHYAPGSTNASTFWFSLWQHRPMGATFQLQYPPTSYYWARYEADDLDEPVQAQRAVAWSQPSLLQDTPRVAAGA